VSITCTRHVQIDKHRQKLDWLYFNVNYIVDSIIPRNKWQDADSCECEDSILCTFYDWINHYNKICFYLTTKIFKIS